MSIQQSDLVFYKSTTMNDTPTNGGRMSATAITDGVKNNLWPDVSQAERVAGSNKYRKVHLKVNNTEGAVGGLALQNSKVYVEDYTEGDDSMVIFPGTDDDIQSELTGSERKYGNGQLQTTVAPGATSVSVVTEDGAIVIFVDGDEVRISDKTDIDDLTGVEEYFTISNVSYASDVATFDVSPAIASDFAAADTRIGSIITSFGNVSATSSAEAKSSTSGTIDTAGNPIVVPNNSGIADDWTLNFTSSTAFTITGAATGLLGTGGTVGGGASPNNPDYSNPYFTIPAAFFGGTWANNDTVTFTTEPASMPLWYNRDVPAGAASSTANGAVVAVDGESE